MSDKEEFRDSIKKIMEGTKTDVTVIPKDCCVCDSCNKALTDEKFVVTEYCFWYRGWLYCENCHKKAKPDPDKDQLITDLQVGEDVSNTDLAKPIVLEFGDGKNE